MRNHSLLPSIAFAESLSTITSLGTVWFTTTKTNVCELIEPVKEFLAEHIFFPVSQNKEQAKDCASMFLQGFIMLGMDFTTTITGQMLAEGEFSRKELQKAATGKAFGVGTTLVTLELLKHSFPDLMEKVENTIIQHLPDFMKQELKENPEGQKEIAHMLVIAIPSTVISALVSYFTQRKASLQL